MRPPFHAPFDGVVTDEMTAAEATHGDAIGSAVSTAVPTTRYHELSAPLCESRAINVMLCFSAPPPGLYSLPHENLQNESVEAEPRARRDPGHGDELNMQLLYQLTINPQRPRGRVSGAQVRIQRVEVGQRGYAVLEVRRRGEDLGHVPIVEMLDDDHSQLTACLH
jgi:hypothetical protein